MGIPTYGDTGAATLTGASIRNFREIGRCDVDLGATTLLDGDHVQGKWALVDALMLVSDAVTYGLSVALEARGGIGALLHATARGPVRRVGVTVAYGLEDGTTGSYGFVVAPADGSHATVLIESCTVLEPDGKALRFDRLGEVPTAKGFLVPEIDVARDELSLTHMTASAPVAGLRSFLATWRCLSPEPDPLRERAHADSSAVTGLLEGSAAVRADVDEAISRLLPGAATVTTTTAGTRRSSHFVDASGGEVTFVDDGQRRAAWRSLALVTAASAAAHREAAHARMVGVDRPSTTLLPGTLAEVAALSAGAGAEAGLQLLVATDVPPAHDVAALEALPGCVHLTVTGDATAPQFGPIATLS